MTTPRQPTFVDVLRASQLLESRQLDELGGCPEARDPDQRALARVVLERGWLTSFQVNRLLQGRTKELTLGSYRLLDRLGEGGMGQVFKAHHQIMNRTVALKVIRNERLGSAEAVKRFHQEVQAAAQLVHPNIVMAYDAGQVDKTHFFAMEFIEGVDLSRLVRKSGPLPVAQACDFIRQAALGLQHAHERGMVHRDIKPANLLVTRIQDQGSGNKGQGPGAKGHKSEIKGKEAENTVAPVVKILDMGLARLQGAAEQNKGAMTQSGTVLGTPDYLAPEQALDSHAADIRSDLYSLGCTMYFALTGIAPFRAESLAEILLKHQMEEAAPLEQVRADVPVEICAIVRRLLAKRPDDRFQTPAELVAALEPWCNGADGRLKAPAMLQEPRQPVAASPWASLSDTKKKRAAPKHESASSGSKTDDLKRKSAVQLSTPAIPVPEQSNRNIVFVLAAVGGGMLIITLLAVGGIIIAKLGSNKQPTEAQASRTAQDTNSESDKSPITDKQPPGKRTTKNTSTARELVKPVERPPDPPPRTSSATISNPAEKPIDKPVENRPAIPPVLPPAPIAVQPLLLASLRGSINGVAFTPDGNRAITAGPDQSLYLWDLAMGKEIKRMEGHTAGILACSFSADCRLVLTSSRDNTVRLWDTLEGRELRRIDPFAKSVTTVALSPDGKQGLSGGADGMIRLWDMDSGRELRRFEGHTNSVTKVCYCPDGRRLLSCGSDRSVRVWELVSGRELNRFNQNLPMSALVCFPDGRRFATGCIDRIVRINDLEDGRELDRFAGNGGTVSALCVSADGKRLLSASRSTTVSSRTRGTTFPSMVILWETDTRREMGRFDAQQVRTPHCLAVSPDGKYALCGGLDGMVHIDLAKPTVAVAAVTPPRPDTVPPGPEITNPKPPTTPPIAPPAEGIKEVRRFEGLMTPATAVAFSPDGRWIATAGGRLDVSGKKSSPVDCTLRLWDVGTAQIIRRFDGHQNSVACVAFSHDGRMLLSGSADQSIRLWEVESGKELRRVQADPRGVLCVAFSPDDRFLVSGGNDRSLCVWDTVKWKQLRRLTGHSGAVRSAALCGDGRRALSGCDDGKLRLWDLNTGATIRSFEGHAGAIQSVALSADDRWALSCGTDRSVRLWDVDAGKELRQFPGHINTVTSVAFTPDGYHAVSASAGGIDRQCIRLWDVTGGSISQKVAFDRGVLSLAISNDGKYCVTSSADMSMRLWSLPKLDLVVARSKESQSKLPEPDVDAQARSAKSIKDVYQAEYAKRRPADQKDLALKLFKQGTETRDDPAARFVLYREARELAAQAGDVDLALRAAEEMADSYSVNELDLKIEVLKTASNAPGGAHVARRVAEACLTLIDETVAADNYEAASRIVDLAMPAAKKGNLQTLIARVDTRIAAARETLKEFERLQATPDKLRPKPDDGQANLDVGKFLCLMKGDWKTGLEMLALSGDPTLGSLAKKDLANPTDPAAQVELGDAWWDLAERDPRHKVQLQRRANYWYMLARPKLSGLTLSRIDKRVQQVTD